MAPSHNSERKTQYLQICTHPLSTDKERILWKKESQKWRPPRTFIVKTYDEVLCNKVIGLIPVEFH